MSIEAWITLVLMVLPVFGLVPWLWQHSGHIPARP
jgi:hypothetical protein